VTLVARSRLPLASALGEPVARRVTELHRRHVATHLGRRVERVAPDGEGAMVVLDDGTRLGSDLVIVAHGTPPATAWAGADDGVLVDDRLRAAGAPRVYAAGGAAVHATASGARYRIDHWDAAAAQGAHAARTVLHDLAGAPDPGPYVPVTGFTLQVHGTVVTAYGAVPPDAVARRLEVDDPGALLTTFHRPDGPLVGAVGIGAARRLLVLRRELVRP
jgi:NADPH-dependent 2,4-dienoyl-CoA reductase/sulfur reductase-like enzyme